MHDLSSDTHTPETPPDRWRMIFFNRWFLTGVVTLVVYALLGFLFMPWLVKRYVSNYASETLKRKASIAEVRVNPFKLTFEAKNFAFQEADNRPIVGFSSLFVNFQLSSLFHWAWTFADIRIERPSLHVEIQNNGRLNFADLAESFPKSEDTPPPEEGPPPRLLIHHAEIIDGSFTFSDRSDITHANETFSPLNFKFNDISTIPERKGPYTVKADLPGGGTIGWQGKISLHPIFSEGKISMDGFELATVWKFVQDELNIAEPEGEMDFSTNYRFDYQKPSPFLTLQAAKFALKGILLKEKRKNTPLLALEAIEADDMRFDLQARELMVPNIIVRDGQLAASVDERGVFDWQKIVVRRDVTGKNAQIPGNSRPDSQPWRLNAKKVSVQNVAVNYSDQSRVNPLSIAVGGINVLLNASAEIGECPVKAIVDDLDVALDRISISETGDKSPFLSLAMLEVNNGRIDVDSRKITLARVGTTGGETSVVRDKNGHIRLIEMLNPQDKGRLKRDFAETAVEARAEGKPWSFSLGTFEMNAFQVALKDNTLSPAIVYDLKDIKASLKNISNDGKTPIDFHTNINVVQGGSVNVSGQVSQTGDRADARANISKINLKPLKPAVANFTSLILESGNFSASAKIKYRSSKSGRQLRTNGSANVSNLLLIEESTGERFLEWKEISANGFKFGMSPDHMHIEEVRVLEPGAKVVIFKDRSVNLAKVLKSPDSIVAKTSTHREQTKDVTPVKEHPIFPINIERIRVEKGVVDFADFSLVLPFATHVTDFNGGVTGIFSDTASRTMVKLEGKVDEYGFTSMKGSLSPFAPKTFTDLTVLFQNVEMKPLSPYSATFAGRKIASGTLSLKLEYKIENSELLGDNEVVLEQFTLGERVEAPNAVNLPLDLAIALLTDTEGKIDVAVPVTGNVDNPKFSYGHVIRQALINLITKVVTAPFRALGGLLGDKGEQMDAISFQPGHDRLLPPELKKLKNVVDALEKRPQLRLVVHGRYDKKIDGKALRIERVKRSLAEQMGVKPSISEKSGPVAFNTAKTQRALEKLLKSRGGDDAVAEFKRAYEKETGQKAKRVKPYLAFFGWESSDTAFYQAMFEELVKLEPLLDDDLLELAKRRAEAIVKELKAISGFDPERVTTGSAGPVKKGSTDTVNTNLTLDVLKPAG